MTILTGASVVDVRTGRVTPGRTIRISGEHIESVRPDDPAVTGTDVAGCFVVPGYVDMHAHALELADPSDALALMLGHGVTGYRQMSGSSDLLRHRPADVPDAPALLALPGALLSPVNAGTAEAAEAAVREQAELGADFVKMGVVAHDVYPAAQAEANRLGIPLGGHLPNGADAVAAAEAGIRFIEHLGPGIGVLSSCTPLKAELEAELRSRPALRLPALRIPFADKVFAAILRRIVVNPSLRTTPADVEVTARALDTFDEELARRIAHVFVEHEVWHCPTLIREKTNERGDDCALHGHADLRYVSPRTLKLWHRTAERFSALPERTREVFRRLYDTQLRLTGIFAEEGVSLLAGSDVTGASWEVPGTSLHQEFDELAAAGLSPLRILQATTLDPARFLGRTDLGAVEAGKRADLVLLDADPTTDVAHLHGVAGVVRAGRHHTRASLDALATRLAARRTAA